MYEANNGLKSTKEEIIKRAAIYGNMDGFGDHRATEDKDNEKYFAVRSYAEIGDIRYKKLSNFVTEPLTKDNFPSWPRSHKDDKYIYFDTRSAFYDFCCKVGRDENNKTCQIVTNNTAKREFYHVYEVCSLTRCMEAYQSFAELLVDECQNGRFRDDVLYTVRYHSTGCHIKSKDFINEASGIIRGAEKVDGKVEIVDEPEMCFIEIKGIRPDVAREYLYNATTTDDYSPGNCAIHATYAPINTGRKYKVKDAYFNVANANIGGKYNCSSCGREFLKEELFVLDNNTNQINQSDADIFDRKVFLNNYCVCKNCKDKGVTYNDRIKKGKQISYWSNKAVHEYTRNRIFKALAAVAALLIALYILISLLCAAALCKRVNWHIENESINAEYTYFDALTDSYHITDKQTELGVKRVRY